MNLAKQLSELKKSFKELKKINEELFNRYTNLVLSKDVTIEKSLGSNINNAKISIEDVERSIQKITSEIESFSNYSYQEGETTDQMLHRMQQKRTLEEKEDLYTKEINDLDQKVNMVYTVLKEVEKELDKYKKADALEALKQRIKQNKV
ncbi:hypothetical protein [Sediminitomix flava]|uniref:Uncharacterized protein n=1 Tax=Sediminitomix flava TaxID=379075 RepID=A0A315Z9H4_SEDFL|nr:hypothetical protein [Sediminitomix flava]PWJ42206.1 hypothetical protein BC781_103457 [Sediminitomix flava]